MTKKKIKSRKKSQLQASTAHKKSGEQSKTEVRSLVMPEVTADLTPVDVLSLQHGIGNQATQRVLQRYRDDVISRAPKKKGGVTTFEVDVIKVVSPWKKAPLSPDPALLSKHRVEKTLIKGGAMIAPATDPLKYTLSYDTDTIIDYKHNGFLLYYLARGGSKLKDVTSGLPRRWKRPFTTLRKPYKFKSTLDWVRLSGEPDKILFKFSKGAKKLLVQPANVDLKGLRYALFKVGANKYHAKPGDLYKDKAKHVAVAGGLFPGGEAKPEHVKQTGLGDCYLQAFLINTAVKNPAHLKNMVSDNGDGTVTVRYYHKSGTNWTPSFIKVKKSIAKNIGGKELYHEGALWSHMIEKSFAVFAEKHGQYGDALRPPSKKGYEGIAGGWTYRLAGVFYGKAAKEAKELTPAYHTDSAKLLEASYAHIVKLLEFSSSSGKYVDRKKTVMLTAGASWFPTLKRIIAVAKEVEKTTHSGGVFGSAVRDVRKKAEAAEKAVKLPANRGKDKIKLPEVVNMAKKAKDYVVGTGIIGKVALRNPNKRLINRLYELLNNFKEIGSDSSPHQRFIYTGHAYSVVDASIKDKHGAAYWPKKADLTAKKREVLSKIDPAKSTVTLRNPHRKNEPTKNAVKIMPGMFRMTLEQYLTSFTELEHVVVEKT